jgi:hypothetical protein
VSKSFGADESIFGLSCVSLDIPAGCKRDEDVETPPPTPLFPFKTNFPFTTFSREPLMLPDMSVQKAAKTK